jgi:hypothetical protein
MTFLLFYANPKAAAIKWNLIVQNKSERVMCEERMRKKKLEEVENPGEEWK